MDKVMPTKRKQLFTQRDTCSPCSRKWEGLLPPQTFCRESRGKSSGAAVGVGVAVGSCWIASVPGRANHMFYIRIQSINVPVTASVHKYSVQKAPRKHLLSGGRCVVSLLITNCPHSWVISGDSGVQGTRNDQLTWSTRTWLPDSLKEDTGNRRLPNKRLFIVYRALRTDRV